MNKVKFLMSLVLLFIMAGLSSCNNDDPKPSKTELISRTWMLSGVKMAGQDVFEFWEECEKDNLYIFSKDGEFTIDEGAIRCESNSPQTLVGLWSLTGDSKIIFSDNFDLEPQDILALSKTTLRVSYTYDGVLFELNFTTQ